MLHFISNYLIKPFVNVLNAFAPFGDLLARIWVAQIFFLAGLVKMQDWESTKMLFENVYHVPILPPIFAAYLGTAAEIILPILLVLGLGGRISIFVFFIYNITCVLSFSFLWTEAGRMGLDSHINWGLLLMLLMCHGPGKISLDYLIMKKWGHEVK